MKKLLILGTLLFSTFVFADDVKQKVIAQKLVSVDGTEQGLQNTDKMILEQLRMRLPKDIPENFYVDLIKNLNSEQRKQFIIQRYVEIIQSTGTTSRINLLSIYRRESMG